jgi:1-acylglycerol-3-phosphate O-acyltransferase
MEKFNRWSDPGTGINPFVPLSSKQGRSVCNKLYQYTVALLLSVTRIIILLIIGCVYLILQYAFNVIPIRFVQRPLVRSTDIFFARIILFIFGFWNISSSYADRNRLRLRSAKKNSPRSKAVGSTVKAGDIIICNSTSFIEVLFLTYSFSPVYANVVTTNGNFDTAAVVEESVFHTLKRLLRSDSLPVSKKKTTLKQLSNKYKGSMGPPIVCFAEGIKTNGNGILAFPPIFDGLKFEDNNIHLLGFTYSSRATYSPTFPIGNYLSHIYSLCAQLRNEMNVIMLPADEFVAPPNKTDASGDKVSDAEFRAQLAQRATSGAYGGGVLPSKPVPKVGTLGERARSLLAAMLRIKSLGRSALDFKEFNEYWEKRGK